MKIVKYASIVNACLFLFNSAIIIIVSFIYILDKSFITSPIYIIIICSLLLIHIIIMVLFKAINKNYYVINSEGIFIFKHKKNICHFSFYDISEIKIFRFYIDDNDFTSIEFNTTSEKHKIFMNYYQAKKTRKMYLSFFKTENNENI